MLALNADTPQAPVARPTAIGPLTRSEPGRSVMIPEKIRPELTIEKWPAIWHPAKSRNKATVRTFERNLTLPDGTCRTAKVEVGSTQLGTLTTEDQRTYYGLVKQWEASGKPSEHTFFSIRRLARTLNKKWGTNVIESTTESLRRLRTVPFTWMNSYHDSSKAGELEILDTFTILADLKIVRRKTDGHVTKEAGYFRFHDLILRNLLANHTKPLLFDVILNFRTEIAQLLYIHVDLILAQKSHYERRTKELFDDLGLQGTAYRNPSNRKQKLVNALNELQGVRLSTGVLSSATIEKTNDGKDYKIVMRKTPYRAQPAMSAWRQDSRQEVPVRELVTPREVLAPQAAELVARFHKTFHGVDKAYPLSKELSQAVTLIANHGLESAKYIVDFSHGAAARTNYRPQAFGGILQYTSRALAELERQRRQMQLQRERAAVLEASARQEQEARQGTEKRLSLLSPTAYEALYEKIRSELAVKYPLIAAWKGTLPQAVIRARMAREVEEGDWPNQEILEP